MLRSSVNFPAAALAAVVGIAGSQPVFAAPSAEQQVAALERRIDADRAGTASCVEAAEKFKQIGRDCDAEARQALADTPPRFSSAAAFHAQARDAYAEARNSDAEAGRYRRDVADCQARIARLRSGR